MWVIISGVLGMLGFISSTVQLIIMFAKQKRKLVFCLYKSFYRDNNKKYLFLRYRVDNLSAAPIALTRIQLVIDGKKYDTHFISLFYNGEVYKHDEIEYLETKGTDVLPINLQSNSSHGGCLVFAIPQNIQPDLEKPLNLLVSTNQGKPFQMSLIPDVDVLNR